MNDSSQIISTLLMDSPCIYIPSDIVPSRSRPLSMSENGYINYKHISHSSSAHSLSQSSDTLYRYPQQYQYQEVERHHKARCLACAKLLMFTITIMFLSFVVSVFSVKFIYPTDAGFIASMCLPCEGLRLSTDKYEDFRESFRQVLSEDGEVLECCADTTDQLQIMMDVVSSM